MATLVLGFDSAWTARNAGALVGVVRHDDGGREALGLPVVCDFPMAKEVIRGWQAQHEPRTTVVLLDQPTIVPNATGQRPVENLVGSPVGARGGGVQPANTGRADMFGVGAPIWRFLADFGGAADPEAPGLTAHEGDRVVETYPALALIALGWMPEGRLPKYNPERPRRFSIRDWKYVCRHVAQAAHARGLDALEKWATATSELAKPRKADQDCVDACICLVVALHLVEKRECLFVGDLATGYMVVPSCVALKHELEARCRKTQRPSGQWVRTFHAS